MPADLSRETRIHLALWRKAFREKSLTIHLPSRQQSVALRLALYRSIKPYRESEFLDQELYQASEKLVVVAPRDTSDVFFTERKSLIASTLAMEQLGLTEADLFSPEELAMNTRLDQELQSLVTQDLPPAASSPLEAPNPFFSRDDR